MTFPDLKSSAFESIDPPNLLDRKKRLVMMGYNPVEADRALEEQSDDLSNAADYLATQAYGKPVGCLRKLYCFLQEGSQPENLFSAVPTSTKSKRVPRSTLLHKSFTFLLQLDNSAGRKEFQVPTFPISLTPVRYPDPSTAAQETYEKLERHEAELRTAADNASGEKLFDPFRVKIEASPSTRQAVQKVDDIMRQLVLEFQNEKSKPKHLPQLKKSDDEFIRLLRTMIDCAQKEFPIGPPLWLKERIRMISNFRKMQNLPKIPLPLESWPNIVPIYVTGEGSTARDLYIRPVNFETTALKDFKKPFDSNGSSEHATAVPAPSVNAAAASPAAQNVAPLPTAATAANEGATAK